jgi:hypothetical protein
MTALSGTPTKVEEVDVTGSDTADDGTLFDRTGCFTDGSNATSCLEIKILQGAKMEIPIAPGAIDQGETMDVRIGVESIMSAGTLDLIPYTDSNSVDDTDAVTSASIGAGGDFDVSLTGAFVDALGDVGGKSYIRVIPNGSGAKIKTAELSFDISEETFAVSPLPVFKDDGGTVINGGEYQIFKVESEDPMVLAEAPRETGTTNASGQIAGLALPVGDWVILWRDHNATESNSKVDMSHVFTVS